MEMGSLYGVGVGPGPVEYLTLRAADVLRSVDIIFTVAGPKTKLSISTSIVKKLGGITGSICPLVFAMSRDFEKRNETIRENAEVIMAALREGKSCAFATIGDPMTYSTFGPIMRIVEEECPESAIEVVPGITSFAALAARSRQVLVEDQEVLRIVPGFDTESAEDIEFHKETTTTILKLYKNRDLIIDRLERESISESLYGGRIGLEEELITNDMAFLKETPIEYLSMMVVKS